MRASWCLLIGIVVVSSLVGCSQLVTEQATKQVQSQVAKCGAENRATAEGQIIAGRLWMGDGTDSAAKLLDPYPLTPGERAAFVQLHSRAVQCRQIIMAHVDQSAAWQLPYLQRYAQRSDQLFDKLSSGELPVGLANKLSIESDRMLELDLASGPIDGVVDHATAGVRTDQARRERNADAVVEQSNRIVASQTSPRLPTTYCGWLGNTLNCASLREGEAGGQLR
jgi:hypothetical protein